MTHLGRFGVLLVTAICCFAAFIATYVVCSIWQSSVPLGGRIELWFVNATDGWSLVLA